MDLSSSGTEKSDLTKPMLAVGIVVGVIFLIIGFLDAIGGLETPLNWIDYVALALMGFSGPYGFYSNLQAQKGLPTSRPVSPTSSGMSPRPGRFGMTLAEAIKYRPGPVRAADARDPAHGGPDRMGSARGGR